MPGRAGHSREKIKSEGRLCSASLRPLKWPRNFCYLEKLRDVSSGTTLYHFSALVFARRDRSHSVRNSTMLTLQGQLSVDPSRSSVVITISRLDI